MDSSSPSPPVATPPSRRSKVSTLCLVRPHEDPSGREDDDPDSPRASPLYHKKRQLQFPPPPPPPPQGQQHDLPDHLPLREVILLSPTRHRPRSRAADAEKVDPSDAAPTSRRRRSKGKGKGRSLAANVGLMVCASPRSTRRPRGRPAKVAREEEFGFFEDDEVVKVSRRKKKQQQDKSAFIAASNGSFSLVSVAVPTAPHQTPQCSENAGGDEAGCRRGVFEFVSELLMWKDVAKSSLWFGFGSLCFLSSCFSRDLGFNFVSAVSHVGLFALALAFFYDAFSQRWEERRRPRYTLREEDVLRAIRLILPTANAAMRLCRKFSRVAPVLLFIAKYSHIITLGRLLAIGFFVSFTVPRLFSCYSYLIRNHVDSIKFHSTEAWAACRHKRIVLLSCGTIFWNLFSVRVRIIAAFLAMVILRYHRQQNCTEATERVEEKEGKEEGKQVIEEEATKEL